MQDETDVHFKGHLYLIFHPFVETIVLKTCFNVQSLNYINIPDRYPFLFDSNHAIKSQEIQIEVDEQINTSLLFKINEDQTLHKHTTNTY